MHDYITVSPAQYFADLNSCVIRNLATSMAFDAPPNRPAHSEKTIDATRAQCLVYLVIGVELFSMPIRLSESKTA